MKIVVAGGSGFIGEALVSSLLQRGEVKVLSRHPDSVKIGTGVLWHPPAPGEWSTVVADADVVVNLAGAGIADERWTAKRKKVLLSSRIDATTALVDAMRTRPANRRVFVSVSGVSIYPDRGDEPITEETSSGEGFFPDLARSWEAAAHGADALARVVIPRFGMVLGKQGGALARMVPAFRMGVGGPLGSGKQWMSWVSREDAVRAVEWMIDEESPSGAYNVVAPNPVTSEEFSRELASLLNRPSFLRAPAFALRAVFGQIAEETLLISQRVLPARLLKEGFRFHHEQVRAAFAEALS